MNYILPNIQGANVNEKRVFVRCDFDVPLRKVSEVSEVSKVSEVPEEGKSETPFDTFIIEDDTRLISSISTIEYLLENGATVIAAGHLGRPAAKFEIRNSKFEIPEPKLSLKPVAEWFADKFPGSNLIKTEIGIFPGWQIKRNFYILENLRFFKEEEDPKEEAGQEFVQKLSDTADIYVNEAFGVSHRPHASIVELPKILPHFAGFHFIKEIKVLEKILNEPKRPLTVIIGGAKIETKLPLISKMHKFADFVLVGGELAEQDKVLIRQQHVEIQGQKAILLAADLNLEKTDITNISLENFLQIISKSGCIVWNGPMGKINSKLETRNSKLSVGDEGYTSLKLAEGIVKSLAYKAVGGGDTIALLNKHNLLSKFDFVSVGGGAMLEFLSGESLPGIIALQN